MRKGKEEEMDSWNSDGDTETADVSVQGIGNRATRMSYITVVDFTCSRELFFSSFNFITKVKHKIRCLNKTCRLIGCSAHTIVHTSALLTFCSSIHKKRKEIYGKFVTKFEKS